MFYKSTRSIDLYLSLERQYWKKLMFPEIQKPLH